MGHFIVDQLPVDGVEGAYEVFAHGGYVGTCWKPNRTDMLESGARRLKLSCKLPNSFRSAVRENGFIEVGESHDGSAAWFRKAMPDANTSVHKRLCIDSLTNSAPVFWETAPTQLHSKTFRNVKSIED